MGLDRENNTGADEGPEMQWWQECRGGMGGEQQTELSSHCTSWRLCPAKFLCNGKHYMRALFFQDAWVLLVFFFF